MKTPVGKVVGGLVAAASFTSNDVPLCGHRGCSQPATEGEAFRLATASTARYRTRLTWFYRCDRHEHSYWRQIGFPTRKA